MQPFEQSHKAPIKQKGRMRKIVDGASFNVLKPKRKPPQKKKKATREASNPAQGKRHKNEYWRAFMDRRKKCNAKRRQREYGRRRLILDDGPTGRMKVD